MMLHKFYFTNRVVDHRNSLPNWAVAANNTNVFKEDLINTGNIRILYMTFEYRVKKPEVTVMFLE